MSTGIKAKPMPETAIQTTEAATPVVPPRLEGLELLQFVNENIELSKAALAKGANYYRYIPKDDAPGEFRTQVNVEAFYDALLAAQGINLKKRTTVGKAVAYQTSVHNNGVVLVGKNYIEEFKCYPGDTLNIVVKEDQLILTVAARGPGIPAPEPVKKTGTKKGKKASTDGSEF